MKIANENTFVESVLRSGVTLFLGSGFSVLAKSLDGRPLPLATDLTLELIEHFGLSEGLSLPQVSTILTAQDKNAFQEYLTHRFTVGDWDKRYACLSALAVRSIFTTNIDNLVPRIYQDSSSHYLNDLDLTGASFAEKEAVDIAYLHGTVLRPERSFTFSTTEIASAFSSDPDRWRFLKQNLQQRPALFWGHSISDAGVLEAIYSAGAQATNDRWITVSPGADVGERQYYEALGFQLVDGYTEDLLDYFSGLVRDLRDSSRDRTSSPSKVQYQVPEAHAGYPVRPLAEFFLGAPPAWSDIYSGVLARTAHHRSVRNLLNSGSNVLCVGIPGSGKTTLAMQVLVDHSFEGLKLMFSAPTREQAELVLRQLDGRSALIGVDNFSDGVDGLNLLLGAANAQVLGVDRDYSLEMVSHVISQKNYSVLDVTGISQKDCQSILNSVPDSIRLARDGSGFQQGEQSIFEILDRRVRSPRLRSRYRQYLKELKAEDERLLDFVLLNSYIGQCRTALSMGMLLSFFADRVSDYSEIYELKRRVGETITEYSGELDDGMQDYYIARSILLSEVVVDLAGSEDLQRVVKRFNFQVSPVRIHRFDVFKRRAYDALLMAKIFPLVADALEFYEEMFRRDENPFLLQQGALYLAAKKEFRVAFQWIDRARTMTDNRIFSIRNSHAVIMFKANILQAETDGTVQRTLEESMEILRQCHDRDRRKAYHATCFADQAMSLDRRFGREYSRVYLEEAKVWLGQESRRAPWNRKVERSKRRLERLLSSGAS